MKAGTVREFRSSQADIARPPLFSPHRHALPPAALLTLWLAFPWMVMVSLTAPLTLSTQLRASTQGLSRRASTSVPRPARPATAAALSGAVTNSAAYRVARLARKAAVSGANGDSLVREVKKAVKAAEVTPSPNAEKTGSWTIGEVHHKFRLDRTLKVKNLVRTSFPRASQRSRRAVPAQRMTHFQREVGF